MIDLSDLDSWQPAKAGGLDLSDLDSFKPKSATLRANASGSAGVEAPKSAWIDETMGQYTRDRAGIDRLHEEAKAAGVPLGRAVKWKRNQLERQDREGVLQAPTTVPLSLGDANESSVNERAAIIRAAEQIQSSPLATWPNTGSKTSIPGEGDDAELTSALDVLENYRKRVSPEVPGPQFMRQMFPRGTAQEVATDPDGSWGAAGESMLQGVRQSVAGGAQALGEKLRYAGNYAPAVRGLLDAPANALRTEGYEQGAASLDRMGELGAGLAQRPTGSVYDDPDGWARYLGQQGVAGSGPTLVGMGAGLVNPVLGAATFMGSAAGSEYGRARIEDNATPSEAGVRAITAAATEGIPEAIGGAAMLGRLPLMKLAQSTARGRAAIAMPVEAGTEALTEKANIELERARGKYISPEEESRRIQDAAVIGGVMGGTIGAGTAVAEGGTSGLLNIRETIRQANSAADISSPMAAAFTRAAQEKTARILGPTATPDAAAGAQIADDAFRAAGVGTVAAADMAEQDALARDLDAATRDQLSSEAEIDRLLTGNAPRAPIPGAIPQGVRVTSDQDGFAAPGAIGGRDAPAPQQFTELADGSIFIPGDPVLMRQRLADAGIKVGGVIREMGGLQGVRFGRNVAGEVLGVVGGSVRTTVGDRGDGGGPGNTQVGELAGVQSADGYSPARALDAGDRGARVGLVGTSAPAVGNAGNASGIPTQAAAAVDGQGAIENPLPPESADRAPLGAWVLSGIPDNRGRSIYQVRDIPIDEIVSPELDANGNVQPEKRKYVQGYTDRLNAGEQPPNLHAVEQEDGRIRLVDGHRRLAAARAAGRDTVRALVGPLMDVPGEGKVPLTVELAQKFQSASPATSAPPALRDLTARRTNSDTKFDERVHDLTDFIALNGGLDRSSMEAEGIDPANWNSRRARSQNDKFFGKPLFRKTGGMTLETLREKARDAGFRTDKDVLDLISESLGGRKTFTPAGSEYQMALADVARQEADAQARQQRVNALPLSVPETDADAYIASRETEFDAPADRDGADLADIESTLASVADTSPQQRASVVSLGHDYTAKLIELKRARAAGALNPDQQEAYIALLEQDRETGKVAGRPMVGIGNKSAYVDAQMQGKLMPVQVFLDADNFKALNDKFGHDVGDDAIRLIADVVRAEFGEGNVFHRGGDEFLTQGMTQEEVDAKMARVQSVLANYAVDLPLSDGRTATLEGIGVSYGTGANEKAADDSLKQDKQRRKEAGLRFDRREGDGVGRVGSGPTGARTDASRTDANPQDRTDAAAEGVGDERSDATTGRSSGDSSRADRAQATEGGGGTAAKGGSTVETARTAISQALGSKHLQRLDSRKTAGGLKLYNLVEDFADLPSDVKARIDRPESAAAFVLPDGRIFIIANRVTDNPVGVHVHELGVHLGMRGILGADFPAVLRNFKRQRAKDDAVGRAYERATEAAERGEDGELTADALATLDEEALAYYVEANWNTPDARGIVAKVIDAIKSMLNRLGIPLSTLNASPEMLRKVAIGAARKAADGRVSVGKDGGLVYARDLLGEAPSETAQLVAQWKAKVDAKLRGDGRAYVKPSEGPGDLFGGPVEETSDLFAKPQQRAQGTLFSRKRDNSTAAEDRALDRGDLEEAMRIGKRRIAERRDALGDISNGVILKMDGRDSWAIVMPDVEGGGKWRMQMFDRRGFVGHRTRDSRDAALNEALQDKYTTRDDGALDEIQDSPEFIRGNFIAGEMMQLNAGKITSAEFDKRIADYDSSVEVKAKYSRRADGGPESLRVVAAGDVVDGRTVREGVPNQSSISSSLDDYTILKGIREVPMDAFDKEYIDGIAEGRIDKRTQDLADAITESKEITPLIVAYDADGAYIIEGGHRLDALIKIGAKSLPAMVVIDEANPPKPAAREGLGASGPRYSRRTITINGTERPTTDSTGKAIHPTEEGVRAFWRWFGDGSANRDGEPIPYIHSSSSAVAPALSADSKFGGVFAVESKSVQYGDFDHTFFVRGRVADTSELRDAEDAARKVAARMFGLRGRAAEVAAESALSEADPSPEFSRIVRATDAADAYTEMQRLRGEIARYLGFSAVWMHDETGRSLLMLSGDDAKTAWQANGEAEHKEQKAERAVYEPPKVDEAARAEALRRSTDKAKAEADARKVAADARNAARALKDAKDDLADAVDALYSKYGAVTAEDYMAETPEGRAEYRINPYVAERIARAESALRKLEESRPTDKRIAYSRKTPRTAEQAAALAKAGMPEDNRTLIQRGKDYLGAQWANVKELASSNITQSVFDRFHRMSAIEQDLGIPPERSAYLSARLAAGLPSIMEGLMMYAAPKWEGGVLTVDDTTVGLLDALKPVKDDINGWLGWMVGRRASALKAQGRENLMSDADINALLSLSKGKEAEFKNAALNYLRIKKAVLDVAEQAGLIDPVGRASWDSVEYIPFYRQDEAGGDTIGPGTRQGLSNQSSGIQKLKGGTQNLADPLGNIVRNFTRLIDASLKNNAMLEAVKEYGPTFFEKVPMSGSYERIAMSQVKKVLLDRGVPQSLIDAMPQDTLVGLTKLWAVKPPTDDDVVRVMRDGKPEYYRVPDKDLLASLTAFKVSAMKWYLSPLRFFKKLLTTGVTTALDFMGANFVRDSLSSWVIAEDSFAVGWDSVKGVFSPLLDDTTKKEMMFAGGSFIGGQFYDVGSEEATAKALRRSLRDKGFKSKDIEAFVGTVARTPLEVWDKYQKIGSYLENANRNAIYENAIKAGRSKKEAAFLARDLMDFSLHGSSEFIKFLSDVLPFFNARLQGLYKLYRQGGKKKLRKSMLVRGGMIVAGTLALHAWNSLMFADGYDDLEEWDKDTYWHIMPGTEFHFRVPKPFELGLLFATVPERLTRAMENQIPGGSEGDTLRQTWRSFLSGVGGTLAMNPIPQAFMPIVEQWANKSFFTGRPIEHQGDARQLLPEARAEWYTSDTAKAISGMVGNSTGMSPKRIEHLWNGYTGTMGAYLLETTDWLVRHIEDAPSRPELAWAEMPLIKRFYRGDMVPKNTRHMTEFYEMSEKAEQVSGTIKDYTLAGKTERAKELEAQYAQLLGKRAPSKQAKAGFMHTNVQTMNKIKRQLAEIRKQVEGVVVMPGFTPEQKRERIESLAMKRNKIVRDFTAASRRTSTPSR